MRIPFTFGLRKSLRDLSSLVLTKMGYLGEETRFYVTDQHKRIEPTNKYSVEEFNNILSAPLSSPFGAINERVFHCFTTRWRSPFMAQSGWAFARTKHQVIYTSVTHDIELEIDAPKRDIDHPAFENNYIRINGEDVLEWLRETTSGTTFISVIHRSYGHIDSGTSVCLNFSSNRDAVAFKMVFG